MTSKPFVEYLDKEMNIMGILSAFSAAVAGFIIDRTAGAGKETRLGMIWEQSGPLLAFGAFAALISALFFYRQRSLLARYVRKIALAEAKKDSEKLKTLLDEADTVGTWNHYRVAFSCLSVSFFWIGMAAGRQIFPALAEIRQPCIIVLAAVVGLILSWVVSHLPKEDCLDWW